jgi:DNA-binding NtrC family response regulator
VRRGRVLLVDDERAARDTTVAVLGDGYHTLACESAGAALDFLKRQPIDVLCANFDMPGMTGLELLHAAFLRYPCVSGVLFTGQRDHVYLSPPSARSRVIDILIKPVDPTHLSRTIRRAFERALLAGELQRRAARGR